MRLQTLERGMALLEWVAANPGNATVRQAAKELGVTAATCHNLVDTLVGTGHLVWTKRGQLGIGASLRGLSAEFSQEARPLALLYSLTRELSERTSETSFLTVWDGEEPVMLLSHEGPQRVRVCGYEPGFRGFANCRASGKVILAYLGHHAISEYLAKHELAALTPRSLTDPEELRAQLGDILSRGWALEAEEGWVGTHAVAAPFFGADGVVAGALVVGVPNDRYEQSKDSCVSAVLAAGEAASRILGYVGPYPANPRK